MGKKMKKLVVNVGSTGIKYSLFDNGEKLSSGNEQKIDWVKFGNVDFIGIRIVAPGFLKNAKLDSKVLKKLEKACEIAPLHLNLVLIEIKKLKKAFPRARLIGVSDSAFHSDWKDEEKNYGICLDTAKNLGILRQGYHGLAVRSALRKSKAKGKVIVCHLGGGASVTAIKNGKSISNTMGLTPLEGLIGGSRSGSIDVNAALYLAKKKSMSPKSLKKYFNFNSGLKGITGSSEMKIILNSRNKDKKYLDAINLFCYRAKKAIGEAYAVLNGCDYLIFSGAIGNGSSLIRKNVCSNLDALGIRLE
jgi:acetate kinase